MEATARIVAEADSDGRTRLAVLHGESPLLPRRTGPRSDTVQVHLVGGAAGPLGGDRLRIEIDVRPGAHLRVRTVAATLALPGPTGSASEFSVHATVAAGARLEWLPEPVVAAQGCLHHGSSTVELGVGAYLVWREELVCGRHGEESGDLRLAMAVRLGGRPLLQQELAVGPGSPAWAGPAVLGGHRAAGSVLIVDPTWASGGPPQGATEGPGGASMPLAGPAVLASAVAVDAHELRKTLTALAKGYGEATGP